MRKLSLISTLAATCLFAATGAQAAWVTIQDLNGQVKFEGGNTGESYQFSVDGIHFNGPTDGLAAANIGSSNSSYSLFISNAQAYTDYSIYFVASGMLVAELAFDYLGSFANQDNVQKITYTNHIAQGGRYAAPTTGDVRLMDINGPENTFSVPGNGFESHSDQLFFYNKGIVVAGRDIPEPDSLALGTLGLVLAAMATRRRRK